MRSEKRIEARIKAYEKAMAKYEATFTPIFGHEDVQDTLLTKRLLIAELKWVLEKKGFGL